MTDEELLTEELGDATQEYRDHLLADLRRDDPTCSVYGWHALLSPAVRRAWPCLTLTERIVAFSMLEHLGPRGD